MGDRGRRHLPFPQQPQPLIRRGCQLLCLADGTTRMPSLLARVNFCEEGEGEGALRGVGRGVRGPAWGAAGWLGGALFSSSVHVSRVTRVAG